MIDYHEILVELLEKINSGIKIFDITTKEYTLQFDKLDPYCVGRSKSFNDIKMQLKLILNFQQIKIDGWPDCFMPKSEKDVEELNKMWEIEYLLK